MKYYLTIKRKEILPFVITRMSLEDIMLSKISQTEKKKNTLIVHLYVKSLKKKKKVNSQIQRTACCKAKQMVSVKWSCSVVSDSVTPWTVAHQAPPSVGFSRQEYLSGLPCPSPGDLPIPGNEPGSSMLQTDTLPSEPLRWYGQLILGRPDLPSGFQGRVFKDRVREKVIGCLITLWTSFCWSVMR